MTKIHLYATGDSFTKGVGLEDPEVEAYPARLAEKRGFEVTNDGYPGASHDRIMRRTMTFVSEWMTKSTHKKLMVVVGWGFARRMEFYYEPETEEPEQEWKYIRYSSQPLAERTKHRYPNAEVREFIRLYHENFTNRNASASRALTRILGLQSFLYSFGIPFVFFNSAWTIPMDYSPMTVLVDQQRYYGFQDEECTFHKWCDLNGHTNRTDLGHPDAAAHEAWSSHLSDYIDDMELIGD